MEDHDDNIFDEDDALDYIMSEEVEKEAQRPRNQTGCLGLVVLVLLLPASLIYLSLSLFSQ